MHRNQPRFGLRLLLTLVTILAATTSVAVSAPSPAAADTFGACYGPGSHEGCVPDNFNHWYCYNGAVDNTLRAAFESAMATLDLRTSYTQFQEPNGVCNTVTDIVVVQDASLTARGQYSCQTFNAFNDCDQGEVRLNPNLLTTVLDRTKTACHEIGHSVGLRHGNPNVAADNNSYTDCMRSGNPPTGAGSLPTSYDAHHIQHINNRG